MKSDIFLRVVLYVLCAAFCFSAMAADTGDLRITGKPGIRIYLDGKPVGVTKEAGLHLEGIEPGKHEVRAEEVEFGLQRFSVHVKAGKMLEIRIGRDGAPMVLIPAGEFQMGSSNGDDDEKPVHTVYLDAFYMDVYEVTNAQYRKFMDATGHRAPVFWNDSKYNAPNQPVGRSELARRCGICELGGKAAANRGSVGEGCAGWSGDEGISLF